MLAYLVSLELTAGSIPLYASREADTAHTTAVGLAQDFPESIVMTTPIQFPGSSLIDPFLVVSHSPILLAQTNGLVEVLADFSAGDATEGQSLNPHLWPDQVRCPPLLPSNDRAEGAEAVSLRA
jgi:hypothetical protein